jgi:hypothetical protein
VEWGRQLKRRRYNTEGRDRRRPEELSWKKIFSNRQIYVVSERVFFW